MGPCWLRIATPVAATAPLSWCKLEALLEFPKFVKRLADPPPSPPMVVMALSIKTVLNPRSHTHEVVVASAMVQHATRVDGPTAGWERAVNHFTAVRPLGTSVGGNYPYPHDFKDIVRKDPRLARNIEITANERGLLSYFLQVRPLAVN
jgi:DNA polymerase alpha subunit A